MFRHRNFGYTTPVPQPIMDEVEVDTVDENGVISVSFVQKPNEEIAKELPAYSDYQLSTLLASGVPLKEVNAKVLDVEPSAEQIEAAVSELERADKTNEVNNPQND